MKTNLRALFLMFAAGLIYANGVVLGHDLAPPDFRGLPATVFAEFDFTTAMNPSAPDNGDFVLGHAGQPIFPGILPRVRFSDGDFTWSGPGGGTWSATNNGKMEIRMPNIVDDFPSKYIRVQITWGFEGPSLPPVLLSVTGEDAEDGPLSLVSLVRNETRGIGGFMRQTVIDLRIEPNPDWEVMEFGVPKGMKIHQVVVDTISVPDTQRNGVQDVNVTWGRVVLGVWQYLQEDDGQNFGLALMPSRRLPDIGLFQNFERDEWPTLSASLLIRDFWIPDLNQAQVTLGLRIKSKGDNAPRGMTQTVEFYNFAKERYDRIGTDSLTVHDEIREYETLDFLDYVDTDTGESIARVTWQTRFQPHIQRPNTILDMIEWKREMDFYDDE